MTSNVILNDENKIIVPLSPRESEFLKNPDFLKVLSEEQQHRRKQLIFEINDEGKSILIAGTHHI